MKTNRLRQSRENYLLLVAQLRDGARHPMDVLSATLAAAGRTWQDVVGDVLSSEARPIESGDPCPACGGVLRIYASRRRGDSQIRYLRCSHCQRSPTNNKHVVPAATIRRRSRRGCT